MSAVEGTPPRRSLTISEEFGIYTVTNALGRVAVSRSLAGALLKFAVETLHEESITASLLVEVTTMIETLLGEKKELRR